MKKLLLSFAAIMASVVLMAQSQFYVIMKDGSATSFPDDKVDELTFDKGDATIYGFNDLIERMEAMQRTIDSLKKTVAILDGASEDEYEHEFVDLDLPSGILWATTNVGARKKEQPGFFFTFGSTFPQENHMKGTYPYNTYDKAEFSAKKVVDSHNNLTSDHDAATSYWGEDWKTPSSQDFEELVQYCTCFKMDVNGQTGMVFKSRKNGNSIFLPSAGYAKDHDTIAPYRGYYMSSTLGYSGINNTLFTDGEKGYVSGFANIHGKLVRPVKRTTNNNKEHNNNDSLIAGVKYVDLGLPSKTLWAETNLFATSISDIGAKFLWGETPKLVDSNTDDNALWLNYTDEELIELGVIDSDKNLTSKYDAATFYYGYYWKMPTPDDVYELTKNTQLENIKIDGVNVVKLTGKNGNSIYFPVSEYGLWTSTSTGIHTAKDISMQKSTSTGEIERIEVEGRGKNVGLHIRPVVRK